MEKKTVTVEAKWTILVNGVGTLTIEIEPGDDAEESRQITDAVEAHARNTTDPKHEGEASCFWSEAGKHARFGGRTH